MNEELLQRAMAWMEDIGWLRSYAGATCGILRGGFRISTGRKADLERDFGELINKYSKDYRGVVKSE